MKVVLASQSPRRREMLAYILDEFELASADIDETPLINEKPDVYVQRLAVEKAKALLNDDAEQIVIGSDTAVVVDDEILGKPIDLADCKRMLALLSNREHQVMTAFALVSNNKTLVKNVVTDVKFKAITEAEILAYWQTQEPQDKAGSYAIQGIGGKFVESINGSISSVIGLPLVELEQALKEF